MIGLLLSLLVILLLLLLLLANVVIRMLLLLLVVDVLMMMTGWPLAIVVIDSVIIAYSSTGGVRRWFVAIATLLLCFISGHHFTLWTRLDWMISLTDKIFSYSAVALTLAGLGPTGRKETTLCCCCLCLPTIHSLVACLFGSSHSLVPSSILIGLSNALLVGAFNPFPRPAPPNRQQQTLIFKFAAWIILLLYFHSFIQTT